MEEKQNENTISTLASILKCVCATPKQMNILAVMLAETLAQNSTKEDVLALIQFLSVISSALKSYL